MARNYLNGLQHTCDACGVDIRTKTEPDYNGYRPWPRMDKKYCSPACRQKAYRKRKADAAEAARNRHPQKTRRRSRPRKTR